MSHGLIKNKSHIGHRWVKSESHMDHEIGYRWIKDESCMGVGNGLHTKWVIDKSHVGQTLLHVGLKWIAGWVRN